MKNRNKLRNSPVNKKRAFKKFLQKRIRKRNHGNKFIKRGIRLSE